MKYIPRRTKVKMEFYKGITFADIIYLAIAIGVLLLLVLSTGIDTMTKVYLGVAWVAICVSFFMPVADGKRMYATLGILFKFFAVQKKFSKKPMRKHKDIKEIIPYVDIKNNMIDYKDYYAVVLEVSPIQFWLLNEEKRELVVQTFANALRSLTVGQSAAIVKTAKPMLLNDFIYNEDRKYDEVMELANEKVMSREEMDARSIIFESRMQDLRDLRDMGQTFLDHYYIVVFDKDRDGLETAASNISVTLSRGVVPMHATRLENKDLVVFLKTNLQKNLEFWKMLKRMGFGSSTKKFLMS